MSKGVEQKRSKEVIVDRMRKEEIQEGGDSAKGNVLGQEPNSPRTASANFRLNALTLAEPYGLVRKTLIKRNRGLTELQLNLKGFQFLNINI